VNRREALAHLRFHWGQEYKFRLAGGTYTATARFGKADVLEADDPEELLARVRRHYSRGNRPEERCST
jgi:hypothetical protein